MQDLLGPVAPWAGLVDALGVAFVFGLWLALRGAGDRARAVAAAAGATLLAVFLAGALGRVTTVVAWNTTIARFVDVSSRARVYALVTVVGVAVGAVGLWWVHRAAARGAEDLADDALVPADPDEPDPAPDPYTRRRQRLVAGAPWVDVAAVALAIALPLTAYQPTLDLFEVEPTAWLLLYRLFLGASVAAPLLILARRDDLADTRLVATAFGVVAAGGVLASLAREAFANEVWVSLGTGLQVGLLAVAALPLVARAVAPDRAGVALGVVAALALTIAVGVAGGQALTDLNRSDRGPRVPDGIFGDFPGELTPP